MVLYCLGNEAFFKQAAYAGTPKRTAYQQTVRLLLCPVRKLFAGFCFWVVGGNIAVMPAYQLGNIFLARYFFAFCIGIHQQGIKAAPFGKQVGKLFYSKNRCRTAIVRQYNAAWPAYLFRHQKYRAFSLVQYGFGVTVGLLGINVFIKQFAAHHNKISKPAFGFNTVKYKIFAVVMYFIGNAIFFAKAGKQFYVFFNAFVSAVYKRRQVV